MKKSLFWMLSALAVSGLFTLAACDEDESEAVPACEEGNNPCGEGDYAGYPYCHNVGGQAVCSLLESCPAGSTMGSDGRCADTTSGSLGSTCQGPNDCQDGLVCTNSVCSAPDDKAFTYVRIDDLSTKCTETEKGCGEDPGADIDAIVLKKGGNNSTLKYASEVVSYLRADGKQSSNADNKMALNPEKALHAPDSFINYPNEDGICYYWAKDTSDNRTYVSLGGKDGYLVVQMEDKIEAGDTLDVLEIGDCMLWNTTSKPNQEYQKAIDNEEIKIQVSVNSNDGWKIVKDSGKATNGIISTIITDGMLQ